MRCAGFWSLSLYRHNDLGINIIMLVFEVESRNAFRQMTLMLEAEKKSVQLNGTLENKVLDDSLYSIAYRRITERFYKSVTTLFLRWKWYK